MKLSNKNLFFFLVVLIGNLLNAQISIEGTVTDNNNSPIEDVYILLEPSKKIVTTNSNGAFQFQNISKGHYALTVSFLGFKSQTLSIDVQNKPIDLSIILEPDLLDLQTIVVTGNFDQRKTIESSTSISTLTSKKIQKIFPRGTANLLQNVPGTFTDTSAGEVFTRVYTRGISASAEDDMGWYYVSLQEDGLPVSLVQHSYYAPDLFHKTDLTTQKLEAIRGGSSSITAMNAPGGIYNFISQGTRQNFGGEFQISSGIQGANNNSIYRIDTNIGGHLKNNWYFNFGGHYRKDDGARNNNFTFSKGGQAKFNLIKTNKNGYFKLYGKILNDYTNRYNGVAATNWSDPQAAFGQDFNSTSLLMPSFNTLIPDGRAINNTNNFNPTHGIHAQDYATGFDFSQKIGNNWIIKNNIKHSIKNANWQTSISNAFVSLSNPLAYFISGADFPVGQIIFREANSGTEIARIDNSGILSGSPFQYLTNGTLPNDAIMGTSAWYKDIDANELMQQLTIHKKTNQHNLSFGFASGFSKTSYFGQGSFAYTTYEPNPKMLQVTLENPNTPIISLSDENGTSNYGGLFYVNTNANITQLATFFNDRWHLTENLNLDLGFRYESIKHKGNKDRFAPLGLSGGIDGNQTTVYDNVIIGPTGEKDYFNYTYNYLSYSFGINYSFNKNTAIFSRLSKGNKAPELNYYFDNFANVAINNKGEIQKINQIEVGFKLSSNIVSFTGTAFWSQLKDIATSNFEFDGDTNSIFYTPIQFNTSRTIGFEWESIFKPLNYISFDCNGVIQNPKATKWKIYDASGTVDTNDDNIQDFSGNNLAFNPKLLFNLGSNYSNKKLSALFKWQFIGKRQGNVSNGFQLDAYSVFNAGIGYELSKNLSANLLVNNLFNSEGLANFYGANSFGASGSGATPEFVANNPDASFIVIPILPRSSLIRLNYKI